MSFGLSDKSSSRNSLAKVSVLRPISATTNNRSGPITVFRVAPISLKNSSDYLSIRPFFVLWALDCLAICPAPQRRVSIHGD